ncbi:MAG TPA: PAS domain-containing protein [Alphaproteobacteria bacterium]|nr:PAS domain-containing protein [Alphaproteobacteria bacterium]
MSRADPKIDDAFLRGLYQHWKSKRGRRPYPKWSDFDPLELRPWLGLINVVEVEPATRRFKFRIFGQSGASLLGVELTGRYADELRDYVVDTVLADYTTLIETGKTIYKVREIGMPGGRTMRLMRLLMPLSARGDALDMILSAIRFE